MDEATATLESGAARRAAEALLARNMLFAAHAIQHILSGSLPVLLLFVRPEFDLSYTDIGLIVAAGNLTGGLAQMPAGLIVDRWGARRVLLGGYALTLVSLFMFATAGAMSTLLVSRLIMGFGQATFHPASFPEMARATKRTGLSMGMALHSVGGNIGQAGGYSITVLLAALLGWRWALQTMILAGAVLSVAFAVYYPRLPDDDDSPPAAEAKRPSSEPGKITQENESWLPAVYLSVAATLSGAFGMSLTSFLPTFLTAARGASEAVSGGLSTLKLLSGTAGAVFGGRAGDRFDRSNVVLISTAITTLLVLILAGAPLGTVTLVLTLILLGFFHTMARPCLNAITTEIAPRGRTGGVFGLVFGAMAVGGSLAGPVVGYIADTYSLQVAFAFIAFLYMAHGILIKRSYAKITGG